MTYQLPPNILRLFQPRPALPFVPPSRTDRDPRAAPKKTHRPLEGVAALLERMKQEAADLGQTTEGDEEGVKVKGERREDADGDTIVAEDGEATDQEEEKDDETDAAPHVTLAEQTKRELRREERTRKLQERKTRGLAMYDPQKDPEAQGDPFTTLFVARLDFSVTEKELRKEFEMYGPVQRIRIVHDKDGKSRGYAFIVYEHERDMRAAYKDTEGIKIKGRRAMVDVERGRTVKDWKPTWLGGGLGGLTRKKKEPAPVVPEPTPFARTMGGGFRGGGGGGGFRGGRGGFRGGGRGGFGGPPGGGYGGGGYGGGYGPPPSDGGYGARFDGPPPAKRGRY